VKFSSLQPVDKQSLLDSGILCCLIHILNALLDPYQTSQRQKANDHEEVLLAGKDYDGDVGQVRRLEVSLHTLHVYVHICTRTLTLHMHIYVYTCKFSLKKLPCYWYIEDHDRTSHASL
jgi:hypothetical protein